MKCGRNSFSISHQNSIAKTPFTRFISLRRWVFFFLFSPKQFLSLFIIFQPRKICFPICLLLIEGNFKCYKSYITTLLQILHTRLDRWVAPTTLICPILRPVLHKFETAQKIKVTKLSKVKRYMYKLIILFLVEAENGCTIWWFGSL